MSGVGLRYSLVTLTMGQSRYRLLGKVGTGSFGRVFCAVDRARGNLVALKDLDFSGYPTKKFLREISYLVALRHPNIVSFQGLEHHGRGRYLVLDYCNGGTLRDLMEAGGALDLHAGLRCIAEILGALQHAHERGIVHCDIKPENILVNVTRDGWSAKISDFGISRLVSEARTRGVEGGYTGSPAYMAPERYYGKYSPASDLYAVGILLFELITGERPFSGLPDELMKAHLTEPATIPESIPAALRALLEISLRKLPRRRFESAGKMRQALLEAMAGLSPRPLLWSPSTVFSLGIVEREGPGDFFREEEWDRVRARLPGSEVFPLDRRYGIAVSRSGGATELRPVNRRGTLYPGFVLPFALHDLTRHPDLSDRLLGIERSPRPRGAIVCLKPFRVTRTPFPGFLPDSVRCVEGGYRLERGDRAVEIRWER